MSGVGFRHLPKRVKFRSYGSNSAFRRDHVVRCDGVQSGNQRASAPFVVSNRCDRARRTLDDCPNGENQTLGTRSHFGWKRPKGGPSAMNLTDCDRPDADFRGGESPEKALRVKSPAIRFLDDLKSKSWLSRLVLKYRNRHMRSRQQRANTMLILHGNRAGKS